jgi:DNA-binding transcriptional LysR family regulator
MAQVEAFLAVADELHFGRAAERLQVSQPRVSRLVAALERQAGGKLFERTSRQVILTPLGRQLRAEFRPAYDQMTAAIEAARTASRGGTGELRLGCSYAVAGPELTRLSEEFCARNPSCELALHQVENADPYGPLRREDIDVLVFYQAVNEPDLTAGPVIGYRDRVLAVGRGHRLAARESVCVEDLAGEVIHEKPPAYPLPHLDEPVPPAYGQYQHAHTRAWAETIASFDGFVLVTPEFENLSLSKPGDFKPGGYNATALGTPSWRQGFSAAYSQPQGSRRQLTPAFRGHSGRQIGREYGAMHRCGRHAGRRASVIAGLVTTPWRSLNARLQGPAGLQLTLFSDLSARPGNRQGPPGVRTP